MIFLLFFLTLFFSYSHSYYVVVDSNSEDCFYENLKVGTKSILYYEVAEGGFLDIDVVIFSPSGLKLFEALKKTEGRPEFVASEDGEYKYCFGNHMSSMTPKVTLFELVTLKDRLKSEENENDSHKKLVSMVNELSLSISSVKLEMEYVALRAQLHWEINKNTNFRVVVWAAFEALLIMIMSIGQVFYLKRFFEVRRLV